MEYPKFKVGVRCFTYDQSKYITDTMDGFVMQQTNFPFVCMIVDDASTDREQEVIKAYLNDKFDLSSDTSSYKKETDYAHIVFAQHKTNRNCYFAVLFLKENHYRSNKPKVQYLSEWRKDILYEAYCEGDDYWIDAHKLQKQVDILDTHPKVMMVHTGFQPVDINSKRLDIPYLEEYMERSECGNVFMKLMRGNYPLTLTSIFRREVLDSDLCNKCQYKYDYTYFLSAASLGEVYYIPDRTGCYRINPEGLMHTSKRTVDIALGRIRIYFTKCLLDGKIAMASKKDIKICAKMILGGIFSLHPNKDYCRFVLSNPAILKYLPYSIIHKISKMICYKS